MSTSTVPLVLQSSLLVKAATKEFALKSINALGYIYTAEDPARQAQTVQSMIEHVVSGLEISPAYGDTSNRFDKVIKANIPALQVLRGVDRTGVTFPCLLRSCAWRRTGDRAFDRSGVQEACLRRRCRWESYQR